ncbi:hypothetical protein O3794_02380 [Gemella sanguinis]|uniref:hypothetical protein n=1 Tax=Gemella sanguinis TaxID=84135 RepID=UPI00352CC5A1
MKDMLSIIIRIILVSIVGIVIIFYSYLSFNSIENSEINQDEDSIVKYIKERVEFNSQEDITKIEFKKVKKEYATSSFNIILNNRMDVTFTAKSGGRVYIDGPDRKDIRIVQNKTKKNYNNIEVIHEKVEEGYKNEGYASNNN